MSLAALAPRPLSIPRTLSIGGLFALFAALAWRQHAFVDEYAVNMLFWDQWDFFSPLFRGEGLWGIFNVQHGPHRQGLGMLITSGLAQLSHWNSRWDAFAVSFALIAATGLALWLALRCGLRLGLSLALIPLCFLNIRQYEAFVGSSNLSYGALPMVLLMLYCLAWFMDDHRWRLATLCLLHFLLLYTGFGFFAAFLTPPILLLETIHLRRNPDRSRIRWAAGALVTTLLIWGLFLHDYQFWPPYPGFRFPCEHPIDYLYFSALMVSNFVGFPGSGTAHIACGCLLLAPLVGIALLHGWRVLRFGVDGYRVSVVLLCLSGFTLMFCFNSSVARLFLGLDQAPAASRYVTLLAPGGLALMIQAGHIVRSSTRQLVCLGMAALLLPGAVLLHDKDTESIDWYSRGRAEWRKTYLRTHSQDEANARSNFKIFHSPVDERLAYLEKHGLNLFAPQDKRP